MSIERIPVVPTPQSSAALDAPVPASAGTTSATTDRTMSERTRMPDAHRYLRRGGAARTRSGRSNVQSALGGRRGRVGLRLGCAGGCLGRIGLCVVVARRLDTVALAPRARDLAALPAQVRD